VRLPGVDPAAADPSVAPILQDQQRQYGRPFESSAVLAHRPSVAVAWEAMYGAIAESGRLPAALADLVNRRVAQRVGCAF
jgi:alkylhydroperoxidase family enzyme